MIRLARARMALKRGIVRLARSLRSRMGLEGTTYVTERTPEYRRYWERGAYRISAEFEALTDSFWEVRRGGARTRIASYVTELDDPVTLRIAGDKPLVYGMAESEGVPVPDHLVIGVGDVDAARDFLRRHDGPLVVKPARNTSSGLGVTTYVFRASALEWAVARASLLCPDVLVEAAVPGESCRLLFLDGRLIHAVRRRGARVLADGIRSVREATEEEHGTPLDPLAEWTLRAQGVGPDQVPAQGSSVLVRSLPFEEARTRELRTVYDEDVTDRIHPGLVEEVRPLIERVGAVFCGVDVITAEPGRSLAESRGAFIEINTTPGIHHHYLDPEDLDGEGVAELVLERLLGPPDPATGSARPDARGERVSGP